MNPSKLKNYTSSVPIERTVAEIERLIAGMGATGIFKDYKDGVLVSISFQITAPSGRRMAIRLPSKPENVAAWMRRQVTRPHKGTMERIEEQAARTSWRLMQDWVEVQLSFVQMEQAELTEVFLPYIFDGKQTYYEKLKESKFLALPPSFREGE